MSLHIFWSDAIQHWLWLIILTYNHVEAFLALGEMMLSSENILSIMKYSLDGHYAFLLQLSIVER